MFKCLFSSEKPPICELPFERYSLSIELRSCKKQLSNCPNCHNLPKFVN